MTEQESDAVNPKGTPDNEFAAVEPSDQSEFATGERLGGEPYRSSDQSPTGFWKQTLETAKEHIANEWLQQGVFTLDLWTTPSEDMTNWPADRNSFVSRAKTHREVGDGAAHRIWMFVNGMKLGDKIFVHGHKNRPLLVGAIDGTYSFDVSGGAFNHRRSVKWWDVSQKSISDDLHAQNAFSSSLWGLTVMLPQHFDAVMTALGLASDDVDGWDRVGSDPASEAVHSGQALYDALSDEAKISVDSISDFMFEDVEGSSYASQFAESIEIANDGNPAIWALLSSVPDEPFTALNVQDVNVISLSDKFRFLIRRNLVDTGQLSKDIQQFISYEGYTKLPDLVQVEVDRETSETEFAELWRVHRALLETLASANWTKSAQYKKHRDDVRVMLALLTNQAIPAPAYVPDHRKGLRNWTEPVIDVSQQHSALVQQFAQAGLTYTDSQIASFYTALQTKGFVILSGISGTGKSKIAQRFADMLPNISVRISTPKASNTFQVKYQQYMKDHGQIRLLNGVSSLLPVPDDGEAYNIPMSVNGQEGTCRFWTRPPKYGGTYIHPHGALKAALMDLDASDFWLHFMTDDDESRVDRIVLSTNEAAQVLQVDQSLELRSNHLFLPVRPDWRDGKALIGYHNPLTGEYVRTDFLDFVIAAGDDYRAGNRNAFFVILDEMNLAHVEYYFADVLSVIESGRDEDGWTVEGIPLAAGEEDADLPEVLKLPPNLYIVGTVNMDETTHPFSPKVLDRAFTIELTDVDFRDYPPLPVEGEVELGDDERQALLDAFTGGGQRYPRIDKDEIREIVAKHDQFRAHLDTLNRGLQRYRMHFGYRVFDEIMQFVHNAERNSLFTSAEDAFDHALLMKVLPKFNGSRAKLEPALLELIHWCRSPSTFSNDVRQTLEAQIGALSAEQKRLDTIVVDTDVAEDRWRYPATGRRAALMMQDLYTDGFASFG